PFVERRRWKSTRGVRRPWSSGDSAGGGGPGPRIRGTMTKEEVPMMGWRPGLTRPGWVIVTSLIAACGAGEPESQETRVPGGGDMPGAGALDARTIDIPRGRSPAVDGVLSPGEWDDAAVVEIAVEPGWNVP